MAKKQKETKYRTVRGGILYGILTAVLVAVSVVLACTVFFRVEEVTVEGCERYSAEQVLAVAAVEKGANLILTPSDQIEHRISKNLPYVDTGQAQKRFPTTLKLVITESQPVAGMAAGEEQGIIDAKGKVLEKADEGLALQYIQVKGLELTSPQQGQPAQTGPEGEKRLGSLLGLLQALQGQELIGEITEIDASLSTEISMVYQGRIKATMLTSADFNRRIQIFEAVVALAGEYDRGTVNLKTEKVFFTLDN